VVDYLRGQRLTTTSISANHTLVQASGSRRAVEAAFGVNIWNWHDRTQNRDFFGNDSQPMLPASLATSIVGVAGLSDRYQARRLGVAPHPEGGGKMQPRAPGSGPSGGYTPTELKSAYDIAPLAALGYRGAGQALGLLELDGFSPNNISMYDSHYGLATAPTTVVPVDGVGTTPGANQIEVELDIEVMHAIAPSAPITVWEGPNSDQGVLHTYNAMVMSDTTPSNSTSWGLCEPGTPASLMVAFDTIFKQAAAQGQSFFAASGDSGAYDCPGGYPNQLAADNPASDPYVTAIGGTTLALNGSGGYGSESAWNWVNHSPPLGSGGGLSRQFSRPAWQVGPGVANAYSTQMRQVPDVALDGDPRTGYSVYTTSSGTAGWYVIGGTSAGAPAWAAFAAILNQYRVVAGGRARTLGFANPALYQLGSVSSPYAAFHDVTSGDNLYYMATAGWDYATGWGSFDAFNLVRDLTLPTLPPPLAQTPVRSRDVPPPSPPRR
jgi:kumamolisin